MFKKIFLLILYMLLLLFNYWDNIANWDIQVDEMNNFIINTVDDYIDNSDDNAPSIVLWVFSPEMEKIFTFWEDSSWNKPTKTSVYSIGSISKLFTWLITAKWVYDWDFNKNTKVEDLVNNWLWAIIKDITIWDLVSHFASYKKDPVNYLKSDIASGYGSATNYNYKLLVKCLSNLQCSKTNTNIWTEYQYSNLWLGLLWIVLMNFYEKNTFESLLKTKLTWPLNMNNTHSNPSFYQDKERIVTWFNKNNKSVPTTTMWVLASAGWILTTWEDMMKLLDILITSKKPWKEIIMIATSPLNSTLTDSDIKKGITKKQIGYAIDIITQDWINILQKSGWTPGSTSLIIWSPELKIWVFILTNKWGLGSSLSTDMLMPIIKNYKKLLDNKKYYKLNQEVVQILNNFYFKLDRYTSNNNKKIIILNRIKKKLNNIEKTKSNSQLLLIITNNINNKINYYIR